MEHQPDDVWTGGYTAAEVVDDMLAHAEQFVGGGVGICRQEDEERAFAYLRERGWIGPKGFLTKEGVVQARRAQRKWDERP